MGIFSLVGRVVLVSVLLVCSTFAAEERSEITRHALAAPAATERSIAALAEYLAPENFSDSEKAWSIFIWIGDRIEYDLDAYLSGRTRNTTVTPEDVLERRISVCDGFSRLYAALANAAGLETRIVEGYAKAYGVPEQTVFTAPNHAWNMVSIKGNWEVVDSTWGAGYVFQDQYKKQLDPLYFRSRAEELKFTHWPVDAEWRQHIGLTLSKAQFEVLPRVDPGLFRAGINGKDISATFADPGFVALVTVFEQNHHGLTVQSIPLNQSLEAGREYRFQMTANDFEEVVVMNGGGVIPLAGSHGKVNGIYRPLPGSMLVAGRLKESGRLSGLFQYTVK